jgi:hypothetical protein
MDWQVPLRQAAVHLELGQVLQPEPEQVLQPVRFRSQGAKLQLAWEPFLRWLVSLDQQVRWVRQRVV